MIKIKRVYNPPDKKDGLRILADRLWPRGLSKEKAKIDVWLREAAPSGALRKWFAHDPKKWKKFCQRYYAELKGKTAPLEILRNMAKTEVLTLVYAASDNVHNNAAALAQFLRRRSRK